jgi:hypothetical protein
MFREFAEILVKSEIWISPRFRRKPSEISYSEPHNLKPRLLQRLHVPAQLPSLHIQGVHLASPARPCGRGAAGDLTRPMGRGRAAAAVVGTTPNIVHVDAVRERERERGEERRGEERRVGGGDEA